MIKLTEINKIYRTNEIETVALENHYYHDNLPTNL